MGRKRKHNKTLPHRVYQRRGKYYFVRPDGKWVPLGPDYGTALRAYADLAEPKPIGSVSDLFDRYAIQILPKKAPRTQKDQTMQLELLRTAFGGLRPGELSPRLVIRYRNARGQRSRTQANHELALLSHICVTAIEWEVMESNPCRDVVRFKLPPRDHYVEDADYRFMRAAAGKRLQVLMDLALLTGQREGDLLALRWEQVEKDGIHFRQGKTGKRLIVGWSQALRRVIAAARKIKPASGNVVPTMDGKQYTTDGFQSLWRRARDKAKESGLERPFPFNDLRAKSASDDALVAASARLGHADSKITQRVYRRAPSKVRPLDIGRAGKLLGAKRKKTGKRKAA